MHTETYSENEHLSKRKNQPRPSSYMKASEKHWQKWVNDKYIFAAVMVAAIFDNKNTEAVGVSVGS